MQSKSSWLPRSSEPKTTVARFDGNSLLFFPFFLFFSFLPSFQSNRISFFPFSSISRLFSSRRRRRLFSSVQMKRDRRRNERRYHLYIAAEPLFHTWVAKSFYFNLPPLEKRKKMQLLLRSSIQFHHQINRISQIEDFQQLKMFECNNSHWSIKKRQFFTLLGKIYWWVWVCVVSLFHINFYICGHQIPSSIRPCRLALQKFMCTSIYSQPWMEHSILD